MGEGVMEDSPRSVDMNKPVESEITCEERRATGVGHNVTGGRSRIRIAEKGDYECEDEGAFVVALRLLTS